MPLSLPWMLIIAITLIASCWSFIQYGIDKSCARRGTRRIPEVRLLTVDMLGGWPGGLIGQRVFHHKTQKLSYQIRFWVIVSVHIAAWAGYAWWRFTGNG